MTIQNLPDDQLSLWIAEKLEPKPNPYEGVPDGIARIHCSERFVWEAQWSTHRETMYVKTWKCRWHPRDMIHDPAMTVMLLEKLRAMGSVTLCGDNGWGVTVAFINENGAETIYTRPSLTNSATIGRAAAIAFALANGWTAD